MDMSIKWHKPVRLVSGEKQSLIYVAAKGLDAFEGVPGVYMFARMFDNAVYPLYIGKAEDLADRAKHHFKHNTSLMKKIENAANGTKVFIPGEYVSKPGQNTKKCIALIERALIDHALTKKDPLFNVQGTKTSAHKVNFSGFLQARVVTGKNLRFKAAK